MRDDQDLEARFASLRQQIEERAPSFEAVWCRAAAPRRAWVSVGGIAATVAVAVLGFLLVRGSFHASGTPIQLTEVSVLSWKSPTDFLLDTPNQEFLRAVPKFGQFPSLLPSKSDGLQPITQRRSPRSENNS